MSRTAIAILLIALCASPAFAGKYSKFSKKAEKDSYGKVDSYGKDDSYSAPTVVVVKPSPKPVTVTDSCKPASIAITVDPTLTCGEGYTLGKDSYGSATCSKTVCVVPEGDKYDSYGKDAAYGKKGGDKYGYKKAKKAAKKYESEDKYSSKDSYDSTDYSYDPTPAPAPVCTTVFADPQPTCAKGATLSGSTCVTGTKLAPCPAGYTASGALCTKTTVVMVEQDPQYVVVDAPASADSYGKVDAYYGKTADAKDAKYGYKKVKYGKKDKKSKKGGDKYGNSDYVKACSTGDKY